MLDRDLAKQYGVETKNLKRQVKRNVERFPSDFMFQLTKEKLEIGRRQFGTFDETDNQVFTHLPFAFRENEAATLSGVLKSEKAVQVNIHIMRVFTLGQAKLY